VNDSTSIMEIIFGCGPPAWPIMLLWVSAVSSQFGRQ
jgi:hypothetical protein